MHGLRKYTNYSMQVLAFTAGGDGVKSGPVACHTEQDGMYGIVVFQFHIFIGLRFCFSSRTTFCRQGFADDPRFHSGQLESSGVPQRCGQSVHRLYPGGNGMYQEVILFCQLEHDSN